jgi:hypothetical protein
MTRSFISLVFILIVAILSTKATAQMAIIADHNAINLAAIPDAALAPASNLRMHLRRASVGGNINDGLDALQSQNVKYNRSNWIFYSRGNPGWQAKISDFVSFTIANESSYDVFSMKFCFIDPDADFHTYRDSVLYLENRYPNKIIMWWTIPIETSGNTNRQMFNDSVRAYAMTHGKVLFDMADIESHNAAGEKQIDGSNREVLCEEWSSDGGHINSAGAQRVASAFWWLMSRIAGWEGTAGVEKIAEVPKTFFVSQNYPNPFNPSTTIEFTLAERGKVTLLVYDILGHKVATLVDEELKAGILYRIPFNASKLSSGVYFYRLEAGKNSQIKKLVLMK